MGQTTAEGRPRGNLYERFPGPLRLPSATSSDRHAHAQDGSGSEESASLRRALPHHVRHVDPGAAALRACARHPVGYIAGSGNVNQIFLGALLELLLIIANIGTAVVIVPIMRRQFEELSIGYVTARLVECTFILVGIVAMLGIVTLQQAGRGRGRRHGRIHARGDQGLDVPPWPGLGRRLGERADPRLHDVPHRACAATWRVARARRRAADHHRPGRP